MTVVPGKMQPEARGLASVRIVIEDFALRQITSE